MARGGVRPGAGRPKKRRAESAKAESESASPAKNGQRDALEFLHDVMEGLIDPSAKQMQAAIAAVQFTHAKPGTDGKKGARKGAAADAAGGKFAASPPPGPAKLSVVK